MRELSLDRLRTLLAVADLRSFAAAAKALHLAPPTVTLHVAELESRLGAKLLLRGRGAVVPTAVGASLIERARRVLAEADEALDAVRRQVTGRSGRVRVGASTGVIAHLLPQALQLLGQSHPDIDVQVAVLTSQETLSRLSAGTLDIGLVALPQPPVAGLAVLRWRRDPVMAFVPADWNPPQRLTPAWLAARPLILNDAGTRLSRITAEWFAAGGEHPRARIELNYNDAIKSLVAAGYGAALLPHERPQADEIRRPPLQGAPAASGRPFARLEKSAGLFQSGLSPEGVKKSGRATFSCEASAPPPEPRITMRPLKPALWRPLGLAHRVGDDTGATRHVLQVLRQIVPE